MSYRKIVQIGASGNVGTPVHKALVDSGKFEITVVARPSSTFTPSSSSVQVTKVDFSDKEGLVKALRGNDAVVLTLGGLADLYANSKAVIDAAIEAGVKRVIPSEFGGDTHNPPTSEYAVFTAKLNIDKYLGEKSAEGLIEYTSLHTGPFFDWSLVNYAFLGFDIPNKKATIYSGGTSPFNATTLDSAAAAVVSVLSTPEKFKNKNLKISDFYVSQNEILAILEAETGSKFEVQEVDADQLREGSEAALRSGDWSLQNIFGSITAFVFSTKGISKWGANDDSASLGFPKKDLKTEVKKAIST